MTISTYPKRFLLRIKNHWFGQFRWVSLMIVVGIISILAYTLSHSNWVRVSPPMLLFVLLAALTGWTLGMTRWSIFWCMAYNLLISLMVGVQYVGKILSWEITQSFPNWLESSNWQIFLFIERANSWLQAIQTGRVIFDDGFWSIILIILGWASAAWLFLHLIRNKSIWLAILPIIGIIAFILQSNNQDLRLLFITLFLGLILIANQFHSRSLRSWEQHKLDYPEQLWVDWSAAVVSISIVVLVIASFAPIVATSEGWRDIRTWLDEITEPKVSSEHPSTIGDNTGRITVSEHDLLLLQPFDLSFVGDPLPMMEGTVMWVRVVDPTPRPWRMAIYSTYNGQGWTEAEIDPNSIQEAVEDFSPQGRRALVQRFTLFRVGEGRLFAATDPVQSLSENVQIMGIANDDSHLVLGDVQHYELISWVPAVNAEILRSATGAIPETILKNYLQFPETLPQRVINMAERLVENESTTYDKVIRIQDYIRQVVPYDLESPSAAEGQDVVDYFLFEAPSGFCSYYASAMAILLRVEGIPARVVTGYAPGVFVAEQGNFVVTGDLAHAWVEVYFPGYGWIAFEPTPSQEVPNYATSGPEEEKRIDEVIPTSQQSTRRLMWLRILIIGLIGLIFVWVSRLLMRFFHIRQQEKKLALHPVALEYRRFRMKLADGGIAAPANNTPREFQENASRLLTNYPHIQEALRLSTDLYERTIYSPVLPALTEMNSLRFTMRQALKDEKLLKWRFLWNKLLMKIRKYGN
jgi:hypothetical protein